MSRSPLYLVTAAQLLLACAGDEQRAAPVECLNEVFCGSPRNIAHRGGARLAPENTIPAFANSVSIGADILELDVRRTADGIVVVLHDPDVDRTTDGIGPVSAMTYAELAALDAGYRFKAPDGTYSHRGAGVRVPTLDQVLDAFGDAHFMIEIKDAVLSVAPVLAAIRSRGLGGRVLLASLYDEILAEVRTTAPEILTSMSAAEMVPLVNLDSVDESSYVPPAAIAQPPHLYVTPDMMAFAKRHNVVVQPWTVDDRDAMVELLVLGVDGIITDDPALLRDVLAGAR